MFSSCELYTSNVFVFTLKDTEESDWSFSQENTPEASKHCCPVCLSLKSWLVLAFTHSEEGFLVFLILSGSWNDSLNLMIHCEEREL